MMTKITTKSKNENKMITFVLHMESRAHIYKEHFNIFSVTGRKKANHFMTWYLFKIKNNLTTDHINDFCCSRLGPQLQL